MTGGGYKQPQQALALSYFLAIGQKVDLVINMDGLNESYISWHNWKNFGVEPAIPSAQFLYGLLNNFVSSEDQAEPARRLAELGTAIQSARFATHYYVLLALRNAKQASVYEIESESGGPAPGRTYPMAIQSREFASLDELSDYVAEIWARSSIQLKFLADSVGAKYLHVLQPNQYVGDREFSDEEKAIAFQDPPWEGVESVRSTYPKLMARAHSLKNSGIQFIDLTAIFDNTKDLIYTDSCCHFSKLGYDIIMAKELGPKIRSLSFQAWETAP